MLVPSKRSSLLPCRPRCESSAYLEKGKSWLDSVKLVIELALGSFRMQFLRFAFSGAACFARLLLCMDFWGRYQPSQGKNKVITHGEISTLTNNMASLGRTSLSVRPKFRGWTFPVSAGAKQLPRLVSRSQAQKASRVRHSLRGLGEMGSAADGPLQHHSYA